MVETSSYAASDYELRLRERYSVHKFDEKPLVDVAAPLSVENFLKPPVDVLNTKIGDIIGNKFVAKKGTTERERELATAFEEVTADYFSGCRYVGLLFSAEWCAPCHTMLDALRDFYTDINLEVRQFELVLVSADRTQQEWNKHFGSMPWASLPYGDSRHHTLAEKYNVQGVPALVILDARTGFTVT
jgi:thiol-disulfide isomerase/thioredoxin